MNLKARHEEIYFITFIYNLSLYGYVYLISYKYQTLDILIKFMNLVENQLDVKIKVLRTDLGRESSALKVCYLFNKNTPLGDVVLRILFSLIK